MQNQKISRRDFLKILTGFLGTAGLLGLSRIFKADRAAPTASGIKEAKYYKRADHLAG